MSLDQLGEDLIVEEAWRPGAGPPRAAAAGGDDVVAELAVGGLDGVVALADRRVPAAIVHVQLEELDGALDRAVDVALRGRVRLRVDRDVHRPLRNAIDELPDDRGRLPDLLAPHHVPSEAVAVVGDRHAEADRLGALAIPVGCEAEVRVALPNIAAHAARPGDGAAHAPGDRILAGDLSDALEAVDEDAIAIEERLEVLERPRQPLVEEALHHPLEDLVVGDVPPRPADPGPVGVVPLARDVLDDVVEELALVEAVEEPGERAEIERRGADAQQVVLDPADLAEDRADDRRARREADSEEALDGEMPRHVVRDRTHVVHAADGADVLVVVVVLAELLEAAVQVADVRRAASHPLAIEFEHDPQRRMGRGMLGSEVQDPAIRGSDVVLEVLGGVEIDVVLGTGRDLEGHGAVRRGSGRLPKAARRVGV